MVSPNYRRPSFIHRWRGSTMIENLKVLGVLVGVVLLVCASVAMISLPFMHPDKTQARLLLDHWRFFLVVVSMAAVGAGLVTVGTGKR